MRLKSSMTKLEKQSCLLCVVCGDDTGTLARHGGGTELSFDSGTIKCEYESDKERPCRYRVHSECWKIHNDITGGSARFACNRVTIQMKRETVSDLSNSNFPDRDAKLQNLREQGKLQRQRCKRKKRYVNSEEKCVNCGEIVPLHQKSHLLQHCIGIDATPVVMEDVADYGALAKRAFAIAKRRLESNSVRLLNDSTPRRVQNPEWGTRPGESLSELNPRRKRPRFDFQSEFQNPQI